LVAPLFEGEKERKVILPKGKWYDFYTGEFAGEGEIISVSPGLDKIPVYVKDGGIVPMFPPIRQIENKQYPLEVRHYGTHRVYMIFMMMMGKRSTIRKESLFV
jgi:alpha-glucosidase (family GH31 glycosyl hydrolase)